MKQIIPIFFTCLALFTCTDDKIVKPSACEVENPIENLAWLNQLLTDTTFGTTASNYKIYRLDNANQTLIIPFFCCMTCNYVITVYTCQGEEIGYLGDVISFEQAIKPENLIWEPNQFLCIDE